MDVQCEVVCILWGYCKRVTSVQQENSAFGSDLCQLRRLEGQSCLQDFIPVCRISVLSGSSFPGTSFPALHRACGHLSISRAVPRDEGWILDCLKATASIPPHPIPFSKLQNVSPQPLRGFPRAGASPAVVTAPDQQCCDN